MTSWLWRVRIRVPAAAEDAFAEVLNRLFPHVAAASDAAAVTWTVEGFGEAEPDRAAVAMVLGAAARGLGLAPPPADYDLVPDDDWVAGNLGSFPPIRVGRYFIRGSHHRGRPPAASVTLTVDAGLAFGSGAHGSTAGCLLALDRLARLVRVQDALDLGAGSGILALAVAKTWRARVVAADVDPEAAAVAARNARINGVGPRVRAVRGDGRGAPWVRRRRPYDLIVANILLQPLVGLARELCRGLGPRGVLVLSGVVEAEWRRLVAAYRGRGLRLQRRIAVEGWQTVVPRRASGRILRLWGEPRRG